MSEVQTISERRMEMGREAVSLVKHLRSLGIIATVAFDHEPGHVESFDVHLVNMDNAPRLPKEWGGYPVRAKTNVPWAKELTDTTELSLVGSGRKGM